MRASTAAGSSQFNQRKIQTQKVSQHQEFFINELQSEIQEMRNRQRDINQLKDQYRYLLDQYKQIQIEVQHIEQENLDRICKDRQEVDRLIRELDQSKLENRNVEEEQIRLLDSI